MDYRGFNIIKRTASPYGNYYSAHKPGPHVTPAGFLILPVATDYDPIGIMRAVDAYIDTGRSQFNC